MAQRVQGQTGSDANTQNTDALFLNTKVRNVKFAHLFEMSLRISLQTVRSEFRAALISPPPPTSCGWFPLSC